MDTTPPLKDWDRPYFTQPGNPSLLYYIVYGEIQGDFNIQGDTYRVLHMPEGLQLQSCRTTDGSETVEQFRSEHFLKMLESQHPELVETVKKQEHCYIVQAILPDSQLLNDFRVVIGITTYLLDSGCVAAFDPLTRKWWSPQEWRETVFTPEEFTPFPHVHISISPERNDSQWVYTHGMRKFGRPDLSVHYVNEEEMQGVIEMMNRFIGFMAAGGTIEEGQEIKMASLPAGMKCVHKGTLEDPNFNNVHVEVLWPEPG